MYGAGTVGSNVHAPAARAGARPGRPDSTPDRGRGRWHAARYEGARHPFRRSSMSTVASSSIPSLLTGLTPESAGADPARGPSRATPLASVLARGEAAGAPPAWMGGEGTLAAVTGWLA